MGHLAYVLRTSGPTHGRPPYSFPLRLGDVVPMVPYLINSPRVLGKQALSQSIGSSYFGKVVECSSWIKTGSSSDTRL
jgi:hypothetical protein